VNMFSMKMFKQFLILCRPQQWYKNLLVFLALFFSGNLFNANLLLVSVYAFLILILISSANYTINDIIDLKKDRMSAEKRNRPLASGKIKAWQAVIFAFILVFFSFLFSLAINALFFYLVLALFLLTLAYSLAIKKIFLLDIATISVNFVIRAAAGAFAISVFASSWLVAGIFLFAFSLVAGKRYGESVLLGKNAEKHRAVLRYYGKKFTKYLLYVFSAALLACFFLFSYFEHKNLLFSFPVFVFLVIRYLQLAIKNPKIAASAEKAFSDCYLLFGSIIFIMLSTLLLYLK